MAEKKCAHTTRISIRWGDMDALGHVNNTVYFRYMEQARIDCMTSIGLLGAKPLEEGPVIVNANCTFIKPLRYPGIVEIQTYVRPPSRSSFEISHRIYRADTPDVIAAEGSAKVVWVNYRLERSIPLSDEIRKCLQDATL